MSIRHVRVGHLSMCINICTGMCMSRHLAMATAALPSVPLSVLVGMVEEELAACDEAACFGRDGRSVNPSSALRCEVELL